MPQADRESANIKIRNMAGKFLTFALHHESYGIDVLKVREIIRPPTITALPQMAKVTQGNATSDGHAKDAPALIPAGKDRRSIPLEADFKDF